MKDNVVGKRDSVARPAPRRLAVDTAAALAILEQRWALRLLTVLGAGPARFSELELAVPGISRALLSQRLRDLEGSGLVRRTVDPGPPISSSYALSDAAAALGPILARLAGWAAAQRSDHVAPLQPSGPAPPDQPLGAAPAVRARARPRRSP